MTSTEATARGPHNTACRHCGTIHGVRCPFVQAIEYHPDGSIKRVEFIAVPPPPPTSDWYRLEPGPMRYLVPHAPPIITD